MNINTTLILTLGCAQIYSMMPNISDSSSFEVANAVVIADTSRQFDCMLQCAFCVALVCCYAVLPLVVMALLIPRI